MGSRSTDFIRKPPAVVELHLSLDHSILTACSFSLKRLGTNIPEPRPNLSTEHTFQCSRRSAQRRVVPLSLNDGTVCPPVFSDRHFRSVPALKFLTHKHERKGARGRKRGPVLFRGVCINEGASLGEHPASRQERWQKANTLKS